MAQKHSKAQSEMGKITIFGDLGDQDQIIQKM